MDVHAPWNQILAVVLYFCFLGLGGFFCALNVYLSFLRYPLFRLRGRKAEYRHASGAPVIGSALVVGFLLKRPAFVSPLPRWVLFAFIALAVFDTGGLHWFIGTMAWHYTKKALASRHQR